MFGEQNHPLKMGQIQRRTARTLYGNLPLYQQSLYDLYNESLNPRGIEEQVAPQLAQINDQQQIAEGRLDRGLAARGLSDSSAMATGLGALGAQGATARADTVSGARLNAQGRRDALKQAFLASIGGSVGQGVGIAGQARQDDLAQRQYNDSQSFGFGDILGMAGTAAGAYFGGPAGAQAGGSIGSAFGKKKPVGTWAGPDYSQYGTMWG